MNRFILLGLLRDRTRSVFPLLTITTGVILTVVLHAWFNGVMAGIIQATAHGRTGHVCVTTKAYASHVDQIPNDLAILGVDTLMADLKKSYPDLLWTPRISFGGLLDIPDEKGETREQSPVAGMGVDLLRAESPEWKVLNIRSALVRGNLPQRPGELLIAEELSQKLHVRPGQKATLISSSMYGSTSYTNFVIAGTVRFGIEAMDKRAIFADIADIQQALDMQNGAGQILGFFPDDMYHEKTANTMANEFSMRYTNAEGKFSPTMQTLRNQSGLSDYLDLVNTTTRWALIIFICIMSIVLWNAGLTGGLRRYGEFGVRLAIGEDKGHIYRSMIAESLGLGLIGSTAGTAIGLGAAYYLQVHGVDIGSMLKNSSMMVTDVVRAQIEPLTYVIGFVPGLFATFVGSAISGIGIYQRQTAQLFKELEA